MTLLHWGLPVPEIIANRLATDSVPAANAEQIPITIGDPDYDPLFAYGFGLSY